MRSQFECKAPNMWLITAAINRSNWNCLCTICRLPIINHQSNSDPWWKLRIFQFKIKKKKVFLFLMIENYRFNYSSERTGQFMWKSIRKVFFKRRICHVSECFTDTGDSIVMPFQNHLNNYYFFFSDLTGENRNFSVNYFMMKKKKKK